MKLLLQRSIENLGRAGDVVEVSTGYARNYLLPHGLAMEPTKGNLKRVEELRDIARQEDLKKLAEAQTRSKAVDGLAFTIKARSNDQGHLFGSVGPADIGVAMKQAGFDVPDKYIILEEHIKEIGDYEVEVRFAEEASGKIKLTVFSETPVVEEEASEKSEDQESGETGTNSPDVDSQ